MNRILNTILVLFLFLSCTDEKIDVSETITETKSIEQKNDLKLEYLKLNSRRERGESHFFKVQESIKFSMAES